MSSRGPLIENPNINRCTALCENGMSKHESIGFKRPLPINNQTNIIRLFLSTLSFVAFLHRESVKKQGILAFSFFSDTED